MKKIVILAFTLIFSTIYGGENNGGKVYIPVLPRGTGIPFWNEVGLGAEQAANDYGIEITYEGPEIETDILKQLELLENALAKNPQAIVLAAIDSQAVTPYLEESRDRGIPIIGFDTGVNSPIVRTTVATDNYGATALAADKMAELIGQQGKVGLIVYDEISQSGRDRRDGFMDTITQNYPDIELIPAQYSGTDEINAEETAKAILAVHPDIKGLFGASEAISRGIIHAVKESDRVGEVTIIGFDSGKELTDAIREGIAAGAVTQNPRGIGYEAVRTAYRAYRGLPISEFIDTGFAWYDQSNIEYPEIQELLY